MEAKEEEEIEMKGGGGVKVKVRVLVVDDSPVDRKIVERLLKNSGEIFDVVAVDSGKKAMDVLGLTEGKCESPIANEQKIDIILTDYCMPEMTGYDLLKAVKEHTYMRFTPVVIMSSENDPQRIARCRAVGAENFMLKPLQVKHVRSLRLCAMPKGPTLAQKLGAKRKLPLEMAVAENSGSERTRPCLAEVAVA